MPQFAIYDLSTGAWNGAPASTAAHAASQGVRAVPDGWPEIYAWSTSAKIFEPVQPGYAWDPVLKRHVEIVALVQDLLIAAVKAESERRRMLIYTPNRGKMKEYQAKKQEVLDFRALTQVAGSVTTILNAALSAFNLNLDPSTRQRKFPFAMAEAQLRSETVAQTIARYEAGMAASDGIVATLAATEQKAVSDIRAAPTASAKRAVYAAVSWPI